MKDYDPVQSLQEEVNRFKATNTFNPLLVTGFYLDAACVLSELKITKEKIDNLTNKLYSLKKEYDYLDKEYDELEKEYILKTAKLI